VTLLRHLQELLDRLDFDEYVVTLKRKEASYPGELSIMSLPLQDRDEFAIRMMTKAISDLCRTENKVEPLRDLLLKLMDEPEKFFTTPEASIKSGFAEELDALCTVAFPMGKGVTAEKLRDSKVKVESTKSFRTHRSVNYFKTGTTMLDDASQALLQMTIDQSMEAKLNECKNYMDVLPELLEVQKGARSAAYFSVCVISWSAPV
jgi:hypothetical protein